MQAIGLAGGLDYCVLRENGEDLYGPGAQPVKAGEYCFLEHNSYQIKSILQNSTYSMYNIDVYDGGGILWERRTTGPC